MINSNKFFFFFSFWIIKNFYNDLIIKITIVSNIYMMIEQLKLLILKHLIIISKIK